MHDTEVLIVGAGPVGLTLAVDLGQKGVRCTLLERKDAPQFLPKMERCNARTMEIYRRMGLSEKIRDAAIGEADPDARIVKMLGARATFVARTEGSATETVEVTAA